MYTRFQCYMLSAYLSETMFQHAKQMYASVYFMPLHLYGNEPQVQDMQVDCDWWIDPCLFSMSKDYVARWMSKESTYTILMKCEKWQKYSKHFM